MRLKPHDTPAASLLHASSALNVRHRRAVISAASLARLHAACPPHTCALLAGVDRCLILYLSFPYLDFWDFLDFLMGAVVVCDDSSSDWCLCCCRATPAAAEAEVLGSTRRCKQQGGPFRCAREAA